MPFKFVPVKDVKAGQEFLYDNMYQVVVKAEPDMLGRLDIWFKPASFKNVACPATGHLVYGPDEISKFALMCVE